MRTMEQVDAWYEAQITEAEEKAKREKQQEIALNLLRENVPVEIVSRTTGLTIEQLQILCSHSVDSTKSQLGNN